MRLFCHEKFVEANNPPFDRLAIGRNSAPNADRKRPDYPDYSRVMGERQNRQAFRQGLKVISHYPDGQFVKTVKTHVGKKTWIGYLSPFRLTFWLKKWFRGPEPRERAGSAKR